MRPCVRPVLLNNSMFGGRKFGVPYPPAGRASANEVSQRCGQRSRPANHRLEEDNGTAEHNIVL